MGLSLEVRNLAEASSRHHVLLLIPLSRRHSKRFTQGSHHASQPIGVILSCELAVQAALEMLGKSVGAGHGGDPHNPAPATLGAAPPAPALTGVEVANPGTLGISPAASSPPIACEPLALPELPVGASGIPPGWEGNDVPSPGPMQL